MQETYNGNSRKIKLSPQEIRKMKENMQKVPEIQKKADSYHHLEEKEAEKLLRDIIDASPNSSFKKPNKQKLSFREKIKFLFNKIRKNHD